MAGAPLALSPRGEGPHLIGPRNGHRTIDPAIARSGCRLPSRHAITIRPDRAAPRRDAAPRRRRRAVTIPKDETSVELAVGGRTVTLTNLAKPFWPELGITKGDLLQYYADVAPVLLPHLRDRAMVMKRYPHGAHGEFFFMKRAPTPRPEWIETCSIEHESANVIDFPVIQDLPSLLWVVNLGCIDLNPWYARCDDVDRPDYLHFDLDPVTPRRPARSRCRSSACSKSR